MAENYEVIKEIGVLKETRDGGTVKVNIVSWYRRMPVVDIRGWSADGKPKKGICLNREELEQLKELIQEVTL